MLITFILLIIALIIALILNIIKNILEIYYLYKIKNKNNKKQKLTE